MLRKVIPLCLLSAALLALSNSFSNLGFLACFGFVPLFFALGNKSKVKRFFLAYLTGALFWAGTIYWLVHVTLPGTIILVLYLALYFGVFGIFVFSPQPTTNPNPIVIIPATWVILEYIRSYLFTGFPWALLGYSQYKILPVIQIADITGVWGVSFLVMLVNVALYQATRQSGNQAIRKKLILPVICLAGVLIYGFFKLSPHNPQPTPTPIKISVIQGNIAQELKWDERAMDYIVGKYCSLSEKAAGGTPDLIIWPEAASPGLFGQDDDIFERFYALTKKIKIPILLGAVTRSKDIFFNSALLIGSDGRIAGRYDKLHLVPFGEYIPLKKFLPFLETVVPIGDINAGKEYTIFQIRNPKSQIRNKFAVLICFEDLFPELSREFVKRGAGFLVNITNDAWYKSSTAPYQHLQASVLRAVENRVTLARAANTGISGFISPHGKIISLVRDKYRRNIFIDGFDTEYVSPGKGELSFYTRFGDIFIACCLIFLFYGIIWYNTEI